MRELEPEEALKLIDELTSAKCQNCARLTALLEDRLEFAKMIFKIEQDEGYGPLFQTWETTSTKRRLRMTVLADRLIAYLKGKQ